MNPLSPILVICVFLALCTSSESRRGLNPCHEGRSRRTIGSTCDHIVIPPTLCRKCRIRAFDPDNGAFPDCANIYRVNKNCRQGIADYVDLNPCDTNRKEQLENFRVPANRRFLDFFIYAVCEECCDCVPFGSLPEEYEERKALGRSFLTQLNRGNCPVHVRFDICAIWPQVRDIVAPGETPNLTRPVICPIIEDWFQSPLSDNWLRSNVTINNSSITRFLRKINRIAKCRTKRVWEECTALEVAQRRV